MPAGAQMIRVREARETEAAAIASVHVRSWQTAYRGILPDSFLDALEPASREDRWRENLQLPKDQRITFVAETSADEGTDAAEIVGFAAAGPERDGLIINGVSYAGEIYALYLLQEHRRQGIGHRLVAVGTEWLLARGVQSVVIWALQDNGPARAFYEGLGGVLIGEKSITIGPSNLIDVAYGWPDARVLLAAAQKVRP